MIFYGTTQPIDKNDQRSSTPQPPLHSSHSFNNYNVNGNEGNNYSIMVTGNKQQQINKSNRKQQQDKHQFSIVQPYGVVLNSTPPRKNGQNGSKNGGKNVNGGKGKYGGAGGGGSGRQTTIKTSTTGSGYSYLNGRSSTTHRPPPLFTTKLDRKLQLQTTTTNSGSSNGGGGGGSVTTSTIKPKMPFNNNSIKKGNTNDNKFQQQSLTNSYEKIGVKAPKQVKENNNTSLLSSSSSSVVASSSSSLPSSSSSSSMGMKQTNQNIPRMFQQYEKIQQIFPEFHPWSGGSGSDSGGSGSNSGAASSSYKDVVKYQRPSLSGPATSMVTNGKPSRENSKIIYFGEQEFGESSMLSSAVSSSSKRLSSSSLLVSSNKQTKNSKG